MTEEPEENGGEALQMLEWSGDQVDFTATMLEGAQEYATEVIGHRAIPDVRDGLIPVQRRIVFGMHDKGIHANKPFAKAAETIGHVMGQFHPHGDSASYGAMVRLAQWWKMTLPLIQPQGNWGNPDGKPAAAMRYCVAGETRVALAQGTLRIDSIVPEATPDSDSPLELDVLDGRGRPVLASKLFHSGDHPTLRLKTQEGFELVGSYNHPVLCLLDVAGVPTLDWKLLEDMKPGDHPVIVRTPRALETAPLSEHQQQLALLLGGFVSEGWASERRGGFNNTDKAYFSAVLEAYDSLVGGQRYSYQRVIKSGSLLHELDVQDMAAWRQSPLASIIGLRSAAKQVPELVWRGSRSFKQAFLQALFAGDGSSSALPRESIQISYSTVSRELSQEVQLLLLEFGVISRICAYEKGEYKVVISNRRDARLFAERVGFWGWKQEKLTSYLATLPFETKGLSGDSVPYLAPYVRAQSESARSSMHWLARNNVDCIERWENRRETISAHIKSAQVLEVVAPLVDGDYYYSTVSSIEPAGVRPVYSLKVETEEHSFLTNGFVSHNTEARLSKVATDCTRDLHPEVVRYQPNFTEKRREPTVLPMTFPALLVNGAEGIAWGMACDIPTHNLSEIIDACILVADSPDATLKQIMKRVPAPDFPTGGIIVNPEALVEAYRTGKGSCYLQAKYTVEPGKGNTQVIVVTELPYGVGPSKIIEQIEDAVTEKGVITDITEPPVNASDKKGLRLEIIVKRGGNVQKLLADLMKYTSMRVTSQVNMTVLVNRYPKVVGLKEALQHFIDFRLEVVRRRFEREFRETEKELRRWQAVEAALDFIDEVVKIIRRSKNDEESKKGLMKLLKYAPYGSKKKVAIDEEQAEWILSIQLRRLNQFRRDEVAGEINRRVTRLDEISAILGTEHGVRDIVKDELKEVKKSYGSPRKTSYGGEVAIAASGDGRGDIDVVTGPAEDVHVYLSSMGMGLAVSRKGRPAARSPLLVGSTKLVSLLEARSDQPLLVFSAEGLCYRLNVSDLGVDSGRGKGRSAVALGKDDAVIAAFPLGQASHYTFVSERGVLKRIEAATVQNAHGGGVQSFKLSPGDRLAAVLAHGEGAEAIISTAQGIALRLDLEKTPLTKGGNAGGVAGIKLKEGDRVVDISDAVGEDLLIVHENGFAKRVPLSEYPQKGRGTGGVASADPDKPVRGDGPAGQVVFARAVPARGELTIFTVSGKAVVLELRKVERSRRATISKGVADLKGEPVAGLPLESSGE